MAGSKIQLDFGDVSKLQVIAHLVQRDKMDEAVQIAESLPEGAAAQVADTLARGKRPANKLVAEIAQNLRTRASDVQEETQPA